MADDAQWEIRVYAQAIYEHFFKPALPWTAEAFEKFMPGRPNGFMTCLRLVESPPEACIDITDAITAITTEW